ncbi:MAG TPA: response regulator [Xanthobacteraceae bacterium]|nr:response regulator [Xanthobacteraceae bacterium]
MTTHGITEKPAAPARRAVDRSAASAGAGSIVLVLAVAGILVAAATIFMLLRRGNAEPYILIFLAVLATVGVFSLFALASGILRLSNTEAANPLIKTLVDDAFDAVLVTDADGRVIYANTAYLDLIDAVDANDMRPVERVFIGDAEASEAIYRLLKAAREGKRLQEEVRVAATKNRPTRWLRLRVRPLGESRAARQLTAWSLSDVTRERERQENVFQELQHAVDYLDHAPAGFFSVNDKGDVIYLNATLANWLDQDLAQVGSGGLKLTDLVAGDGAALLTTLRAAPGELKTEVLDLDLKTRSGGTLPVRLYHKLAFGADGAPGASRTLVINRARDYEVDPQRAAEVRFLRFFHNTPMAIATVDRDGGVIRTNPLFARLFHNALSAESGNRSIGLAVAERDRGALEAAIAQAARGRGDIAPVDAALAGDGERFGRFYVTAVEEERDQEAAIVYALETTAQRELETKLNQQQKMEMVGQLAGGIAHDFNNVLSAIIMAADFLLNAHKPTDPSFSDIMQIKQNANRAASLVRHLLAFSRKQTMRPQVLDLGEVLNDLTMLLRRLIGEKVVLDVVHGRDLWPVKVDISQFEQVIVNLVVNARDAMPEGGKLTLRTTNVLAKECERYHAKGMPAADYALVELVDTGAGIPEAIRDKIFDPFFSTKEVGKGTGLGLSTVYGIIKQTGGFVYVESVLHEGSTFRIFLPRHVATAQEMAEGELEVPVISGMIAATDQVKRAAAAVGADLTGEGIILLVEDEEGLRALNARGLASRGYTVLEAGNGVEAIEVLEKSDKPVDLVVSDVVMPEMDGPTLARELRVRNPGLKIIFVSGYAEDAFQKNLPEHSQYAFLPKPFTLKQLVAAVKETLAA